MKKLITIIAMFFTLQANAGFINLSVDDTFYKGDTVDVYLTVSNTNQEIAEVDFDVLFDNSILAFESFTFDYDAFSYAPIDEYSGLNSTDSLNVYASWWEELDIPLGDFSLGYITFEAINIGTAVFDIEEVFIGNAYGDELTSNAAMIIESTSVVPEPPIMAMFGIALLALVRTRKQGKFIQM
ncbi:cohesin domain-containing protein [Colwellia sp. E2M01]|uniref:cohesin domain-containing protein n=1 Tax=Colwellia sp. E2M01 TaxID=2841561 RepID=UPI001C097272|nr:cohesin domain-containing protein [Colwellia sp. E2M01]MBU2870663.1 cohesin domain-containing protein [Colwellia sp. E2M01]